MYSSIVVIYARRGFNRLATGHIASNLQVWSRKYKHFTSKYNSIVVIYARRGFIRLAAGHFVNAFL